MIGLLLSILTVLPDGNCVSLSADSTSLLVGDCKGVKTEKLVTFNEMRSCKLEKVSDFKFSPDYTRVLLTPAAGDTAKSPYYIYKLESNRCDRVSDNLSQSFPVFSPDGKKLAYVRDNNLIIKRLEYNTDINVTSDGSETVFNGARNRDFKEAFGISSTIVWSPGSDYLVFSKNNQLFMYSMQYKWTKEIKMPTSDAAYFTAVEWSADPEYFGVAYLNRAQTKMQVAKVNASTFVATNIYEYTDARFIDPKCATFIQFVDKKQHLKVMRNESGYRQVYIYSQLGKLVSQVTNSNADVDYTAPEQSAGREYRREGDLNYYIRRPAGVSGKLPLVMYVSDYESDADDAFEQKMVEKGYMVAVVKTRGTDGQGREFLQGSYLNMLNAPAEDYIKVADTLISSAEADAANVSIIGTDLNAGIALSAIMSDSNPFKAAVAVSPVTDLRKYNPILTERLMRTEGATPAYRTNSAVDNVGKINKKVLILHSEGDAYTPVSYTKDLSNRLVEAGVQFDMQIFFNKDHNYTQTLDGEYIITKINNFIK